MEYSAQVKSRSTIVASSGSHPTAKSAEIWLTAEFQKQMGPTDYVARTSERSHIEFRIYDRRGGPTDTSGVIMPTKVDDPMVRAG